LKNSTLPLRRLRTIVPLVLIFFSTSLAASDIEIKVHFEPNDDNITIKATIQMRAIDSERVRLGDHNLRLLYDADHLTMIDGIDPSFASSLQSLDEIENYVVEAPDVIEGVNWTQIGWLNVATTMNLVNGAPVYIGQDWTSLYEMNFYVTSMHAEGTMILISHPDHNERFCTAFTELTKVHSDGSAEMMTYKQIDSDDQSIDILEAMELAFGPNPTTDFVNIRASQEIAKVRVYDIAGRLIHRSIAHNVEHRIDLSDLIAGVYVMEIQLDP